jgi:hypothetical protein
MQFRYGSEGGEFRRFPIRNRLPLSDTRFGRQPDSFVHIGEVSEALLDE